MKEETQPQFLEKPQNSRSRNANFCADPIDDTFVKAAELEKKFERRPSSNFTAANLALINGKEKNDRVQDENQRENQATKSEYDKIYANTCDMYEMMNSIGFPQFRKPSYKPPN
ncbi:unnamed protein product, partial [Mesorhabditis belari]|uniref:Uncharacterized protein n=1 Tax=Mesorhabditis belari TaxID=2138241 RepID=A0AAF3F798_9BILA